MFKLTKSYLTRETNKVMKGIVRHREVLDCWVGDKWSRQYIHSEKKVRELSKELDTFHARKKELADAEKTISRLEKEVAKLNVEISSYESGILWLWRKMND